MSDEASPDNLEHGSQKEGHHVLLIISRIPHEIPYALLHLHYISHNYAMNLNRALDNLKALKDSRRGAIKLVQHVFIDKWKSHDSEKQTKSRVKQSLFSVSPKGGKRGAETPFYRVMQHRIVVYIS